MAGMTQKELKKSYFHCGPIRKVIFTEVIFDSLTLKIYVNFAKSM